MHRPLATLVAIATSLALAACDQFGAIFQNYPVVSPVRPIARTAPGPFQTVAASITQNGAPIPAGSPLVVRCIFAVRLTPQDLGPRVQIVATQLAGAVWNCRTPFPIRAQEVLSTEWVVSNSTTDLVRTDPIEVNIDCPAPGPALAADQGAVRLSVARDLGLNPATLPAPTAISPLGITVPAAAIMTRGFAPTHFATNFQGMGTAFIRTPSLIRGIAVSNPAVLAAAANAGLRTRTGPVLGRPDLLLFTPNPTATSLADPLGFDDNYNLVGWAYAATIDASRATPGPPPGTPQGSQATIAQQPRPVLPCIDRHQWMIHADGTHNPNGTFSPSRTLTSDLPPSFTHRALWDVHLFASLTGTPEVRITRGPTNGATILGIGNSPASFYHPTGYDR